MNPEAFKILKSHKLKLPRCLSVDEVLMEPASTLYYFRHTSESSKKNIYISGKQVAEQKESIAEQLKRNEILIEATYDILAGGASLVKPGFVYSELVQGHPITLLRRGRCAFRVLFNENKRIEVLPASQGWESKQKDGFTWLPSSGPSLKDIEPILDNLKRELPATHPGLLIEWFFADNEIIYCDAREQHFDLLGNEISRYFTSHSPVCLFRGSAYKEGGKKHVDQLDIDYNEEPHLGDTIQIINGSFLCHYVTRAARHNKPIIIETIKL